MGDSFNAQQARAKRPCPLWVDAFQRDTQHLEADEVGAYLLILMAMWTRESCDYPNDDARLARVARVSVRLWRSRIGPAIRAFLRSENGVLVSKRLREEATYVERQCKAQSDRKSNENPDKPLKTKDRPSSVDRSTDTPSDRSPDDPSQLPNYPTEASANAAASSAQPQPRGGKGEGDPGAPTEDQATELWEDVIRAVGVDNGRLPTHWQPPSAVVHVGKWLRLGLAHRQIVEAIRESRRNHDEPPKGPKAYDGILQRLADELQSGLHRPASSPPGGPRQGETLEEKKARWSKIAGEPLYDPPA